jgi:hypothetical protein
MACKLLTVKANVFVEDKGTSIPMLIIKSVHGYYVRFSKNAGLNPRIREPKNGFTTAWLVGNPMKGFVLPKGFLL